MSHLIREHTRAVQEAAKSASSLQDLKDSGLLTELPSHETISAQWAREQKTRDQFYRKTEFKGDVQAIFRQTMGVFKMSEIVAKIEKVHSSPPRNAKSALSLSSQC